MLKRPKPGEDEDDLLEFQKQFLAQKAEPSANVVKETGDNQGKRDVVKLEGLPAQMPTRNEPPPMKKSKFRSERPLKQPSAPVACSDPDDIIDEHERSTATVLAQIIEKDTRYGQFNMPTHVKVPFPVVSQLPEAKTQEPTTQKKRSLFAQEFCKEQSEKPIDNVQSQANVTNSIDQSQSQIMYPHLIDGSGLSATFSSREASEIHRENVARLSGMTPDQILQEQDKLVQTLDPKLLEFLKNRKSQQKDAQSVASFEVAMETDVPIKMSETKPKEKASPPVDVDSHWVHMDTVEPEKLAWMKDLPPPSATQMGSQARFDFSGCLLTPDADVPVSQGLHHHGDEPERAGYSLEEVFTLSRSSNTQQRVLALQMLARIIVQAKQGAFTELVESPVLPSILDAGVVFLLRWALDDSMEAVVVAAVCAFNSLLVNHSDEMCLHRTFHWYQGHRLTCQAPIEPESVGIKLPTDLDETPQETDAEVVKKDIILGLVERMNLLPRLCYVLNKVRPQAPAVVAILEILTRVCRHSTQMAYKVFIQKGLIELIIKEFLPMSGNWTGCGVLSDVYGMPLREALTLILTLCQAGRNMAAILLIRFGIQERFLRYILTDTTAESSAVYKLRHEALKAWKVCLSYGLADTIYIDAYPKIVSELQACIASPDESHDLLSALIGCLEMAVVTATNQQRAGQFKHEHHGGSSEVPGSHDEADVTSCLTWSHVADLVRPVTLILQQQLTNIASHYPVQKRGLQLCQSCLNFITTFYTCAQNQLLEGDLMECLKEMEGLFTFLGRLWNSVGFTYLLGRLSTYSNMVQTTPTTGEAISCLPEYWSSSVDEEKLLPLVRLHSPFPFVTALYRLIYNFAKINKGLLKISTTDKSSVVFCAIICPDVWSYLRRAVLPSSSSFSHFTKCETHLQYFVIKLLMLVLSFDESITVDRLVVHQLSLSLLTSLQYGEEYLAHDLLSTVVFSPLLCRGESEDETSAQLEEMHVSSPPSTGMVITPTAAPLPSSTGSLSEEACGCLPAVRATYIMAFSHMEESVMESRHHFMQGNWQAKTCFSGHIGECLMPRDWVYMPLIDLYNQYSTVGLEIQNALSVHQLDQVRHVLRWVYLLERKRSSRLESVSVTLKISRVMCVFLTGNDLFLDKVVHSYLEGLFCLYTRPSLLARMNFEEKIPGLPSFYDLFVAVLQQYEAVSFGDPLFACYLLIPMQQRHSIEYRKAIWTENTGILRTLTLPLDQLLLDINHFLAPEETDPELVRLYYQALYGGSLRRVWSPVLYLVAVHHVNRFLYAQDKTHLQLKRTMMSKMLASNNQELQHHIVYYKKVDLSLLHGMELYTELPAIRQQYTDSLKSSI